MRAHGARHLARSRENGGEFVDVGFHPVPLLPC
jgi:hypothetical protein